MNIWEDPLSPRAMSSGTVLTTVVRIVSSVSAHSRKSPNWMIGCVAQQ